MNRTISAKVFLHLMFGLLVIMEEQILKLTT